MDSGTLLSRLMDVRRTSEMLIEPLEAEDLCLQGMADASPPKWHLAHTTWFFAAQTAAWARWLTLILLKI